MTFGEYKANGGEYDYKVPANDCGSFGKRGSTIYGQPASIDDWEIEMILREEKSRFELGWITTLYLVSPYGA